MTGDSENEIERPGESSVPSVEPRPDGENSFRPFRGWASAYQPPPPSLWSRLAGLFSRKATPEAEAESESPSHLLAEASALAGSRGASADDDAEPERAEVDEIAIPETDAPAAPRDDYQVRDVLERDALESETDYDAFEAAFDAPLRDRDDAVSDVPAEPVAEAVAEPADEARSDAAWLDAVEETSHEVIPEPPRQRRGFFGRLFSRRQKAEPEFEGAVPVEGEADYGEAAALADAAPGFDVEETVEELEVVESIDATEAATAPDSFAPPEPVEPEIPQFLQEPPRFSRPVPVVDARVTAPMERPNLDDPAFFVPDEIQDSAGDREEASLDEALPAAPREVAFHESPTEPWPLEEEPVAEKKPGFFSRLFGRRTPPAIDATEQPELEAPASDDAFPVPADAFAEEPPAPSERYAPPSFATMDEALPGVGATASEARTDEPAAPPAAEPDAAWEFEETLSEPTPVTPRAHAPVSDSLFGDTIDPGDVQPAFGAHTFDEHDARPTIETTPARDTVRAEMLEDESTDEFVQPVPPEVDAAAEAERPPFFVPKFRSFYNEIVLYKHQKSQFTGGFATAIVDYTADLTPDAAAQALSKRLQEILDLQNAEAMWMGGEAAARYPDAQYAMAVLADELFTHMEWPGQQSWQKYLLEPRMFRTHAADVEFFKRVDRLLKNEAVAPSRAARDLARLYLLVIASGFQGKYRPFELKRPLAEYRRRLFEFIYEGDALMLYASERRLFPEATERTLESRAVARFSGLQQWAAALLVILLGYTLLANFAWQRVSEDLTDVTARVEAASRTTSSDGSWNTAATDSTR